MIVQTTASNFCIVRTILVFIHRTTLGFPSKSVVRKRRIILTQDRYFSSGIQISFLYFITLNSDKETRIKKIEKVPYHYYCLINSQILKWRIHYTSLLVARNDDDSPAALKWDKWWWNRDRAHLLIAFPLYFPAAGERVAESWRTCAKRARAQSAKVSATTERSGLVQEFPRGSWWFPVKKTLGCVAARWMACTGLENHLPLVPLVVFQ